MDNISPDLVFDLLCEMELDLLGNKVAILRDEGSTTYGNTNIVIHDDFQSTPLTGTVVWHGTEVDDTLVGYLPIGAKARYQRIGATEDRIVFPTGEAANIVIVSAHSVFYAYPDKGEEEEEYGISRDRD